MYYGRSIGRDRADSTLIKYTRQAIAVGKRHGAVSSIESCVPHLPKKCCITIHCAVALSVTALVIKASASVSAEKIEAFIRISIDRQTDTAPGN